MKVGANDYVFTRVKQSGLFHVDIHGRVWTSRRKGNFSPHEATTKDTLWRRAEWINPQGRAMILTFENVKVFVSRLVWFWFNGAIPEGLEVDHIDDNVSNDHPSNLQLLTRQENQEKSLKKPGSLLSKESRRENKLSMQRGWDRFKQDPDSQPARKAYFEKRGWL